MSTHHLELSDVIQAFDELGGEADWPDVEARTVPERHRVLPENIYSETVPEGKEYIAGSVRQVLTWKIHAHEKPNS
jgi:hypothetical protein